jgi:hypothetical protein
MSQLIQIGERKIISMDEISEDGYWQSIEGEWVPTEKQLEAIDNGAIPHDNVIVNQGGRESIHDTFTHQVKDISAESKTLEMNKCAACDNSFEGAKSRNCPGRKCSNPICLDCDPLESLLGKTLGALGTVVDVITGDIGSLVSDKVEGELKVSRVRCKECVKRDQREDVMLISALFSFFFAFIVQTLLRLFLPFNALILYLVGYLVSFYLLMKLLYKFYSIHLQYFAPLLKKVPRKLKNTLAVASATISAGLFLLLLFGSGTDYSDNAIVGEWHNSVETMDFKSDGSVVHSDSSIISWRDEGNDLFLQFEGDSEYEYYYVYQISESYLFIAPYADTNRETILENDCIVMSNEENAKNQSYWNEANINPPKWCNI